MKHCNWYLTLLFSFFISIGAAQRLPKNTQDFKENLQPYQHIYQYKASVYEGEGVIVKWALSKDSLTSLSDITSPLNAYLDRKKDPKRIEPGHRVMQGYRIQVYRGKSRNEAEKAKQRCYALFPRITPYLEYSAPNYRVNVGDFLETNEYIHIYNRLKKEFPKSLVVPDIVNVIVVDEE